MHYRKLGRSGMRVSRLCLGTMNFGPYTEEKEAFRIMDAALDAGITFFDTSNTYGGEEGQKGRTEEIIGRWFSQGNGRRDRVVIATKVYMQMFNPLDGPNDEGGLSAYKIRRSIEGSLRRLQTDHVELYQMHHVDRSVLWDELWEVFDSLIRKGQIVYVGSCNFAAWNLVEAQAAARERKLFGLVSEQHKYNLLCRLPELEVLPAARALGLGVIAWSPLAGGVLGAPGPHGSPHGRTDTAEMRSLEQTHRSRLDAFAQVCREIGETPSTVALAWILHNPALVAPIIGPRTSTQLQESLRAIELTLSEDLLKKIDAIFPGPGGAAPEAYAW